MRETGQRLGAQSLPALWSGPAPVPPPFRKMLPSSRIHARHEHSAKVHRPTKAIALKGGGGSSTVQSMPNLRAVVKGSEDRFQQTSKRKRKKKRQEPWCQEEAEKIKRPNSVLISSHHAKDKEVQQNPALFTSPTCSLTQSTH